MSIWTLLGARTSTCRRSPLPGRIVGVLVSIAVLVVSAVAFVGRPPPDEVAVIDVVHGFLRDVRRGDRDAARDRCAPPPDDATLERWRRVHGLRNLESSATRDVRVDGDEACAHVTPGGQSLFLRLARRPAGWKIVELGAAPSGACAFASPLDSSQP